jgi:Subtilisin inhibitor-like
MRAIVGLALGVAVLAACATGSAGTSQTTSLKVTFWASGPDTSEPRRWTLRCSPAGGTLSRAAVACRRLAAGGWKLFAPVSPGAACTTIYGGPQTARVVGKLEGRPVWANFNRTNGCQISRWEAVSPWLIPAGGATS